MGILKRLQDGVTAAPQMDVDGSGKWSARSQRDSLEIIRCRSHIGRIDVWINILREDINKLESRKPHYVSQVAAGQGQSDMILKGLLEELGKQRERLQVYEDSKKELQAKIKALEEPTEGQKRERREHQSKIARLAELRGKLDQQVAAGIESLRKLLNERAELTSSMRQECEATSFTLVGDHLDEGRFQELAKHLPSGIEEHSHGWLNWFFGKWRGDAVCTVTAETASVPETLASPNVFLKGEKVVIPQDALPSVRHAVRW